MCVLYVIQVDATWCCWWLQGEQPRPARLWGHILLLLCVFHQVCLWSVTGHIHSQPGVSWTKQTSSAKQQHIAHKVKVTIHLEVFCFPCQMRLWCRILACLTSETCLPHSSMGSLEELEVFSSATWLWDLIRLLPISKFKSTELQSTSLVGFKVPDSSLTFPLVLWVYSPPAA